MVWADMVTPLNPNGDLQANILKRPQTCSLQCRRYTGAVILLECVSVHGRDGGDTGRRHTFSKVTLYGGIMW